MRTPNFLALLLTLSTSLFLRPASAYSETFCHCTLGTDDTPGDCTPLRSDLCTLERRLNILEAKETFRKFEDHIIGRQVADVTSDTVCPDTQTPDSALKYAS